MRIKSKLQQTVLFISLGLPLPLLAGNLDSSTPPESTYSYTLEDIYNRLDQGETGNPSVFTEPTSGPSSSGHTLDEVMSKAPVKDNVGGALPSDVVSGKTFWGLRDGNWGLQVGTMTASPQTPTTTGSGYFAQPNPRFTDNGDGTVTDNLTQLMWLKDASCLGLVTSVQLNTQIANLNSGANSSCGDYIVGKYNDWRLPEIEELQSLVNYNYFNPALSNGSGTGKWVEGDVFLKVNIQNRYWSATQYRGGVMSYWGLDFDSGVTNDASCNPVSSARVWPVRGGQ